MDKVIARKTIKIRYLEGAVQTQDPTFRRVALEIARESYDIIQLNQALRNPYSQSAYR